MNVISFKEKKKFLNLMLQKKSPEKQNIDACNLNLIKNSEGINETEK